MSTQTQLAVATTAAIDAIETGDLEALCALLNAEPAIVHLPLDDGRTEYEPGQRPKLLHAVFILAKAAPDLPVLELTRALLDAGADANGVTGDPKGNTALALAAIYGFVEALDMLIEAGARVDDAELDAFGMSALDHCLFAGVSMAAAQRLADLGAPLSVCRSVGLGRMENVRAAADELRGELGLRTAAFLTACMCGQLEVVRFLVEECQVDVDIFPPGEEFGGVGGSGLHWAASGGYLDVVTYLVEEAKADVHEKDDTYQSDAAGWASEAGHNEIAAYLAGRS